MDICLHTLWEVKPGFIGGTERFLVDLAKELKLLGFKPFIICSSLRDKSLVEGVSVFGFIPMEWRKFVAPDGDANQMLFDHLFGIKDPEEKAKAISFYTSKQIENFQAAVFHVNSFVAASYLANPKNIIVTNHENDKELQHYLGEDFFLNFSTLVRSRKTNLHRIEKLFVPSVFYSKLFSESFNLKIRNAKIGINLQSFPAITRSVNRNDAQISILLPSRLEPYQKGHDLAIKALASALLDSCNYKMTFTGIRDDNRANLKTIESMPEYEIIKNNIIFKSFSNINDAYQDADIVISPERYCSYGLSVSESLSLGIPTILSNIPTYKEIGKNTPHAVFFKSGDFNDLRQKIDDVAQSLTGKDDKKIIFRMKNDLRDCAKLYAKEYLEISGNNNLTD